MRTYDLTPHQFAIKAMRKVGVSNPKVETLLSPSPRYAQHRFDGQVRDERPRLLLRPEQVEQIRRRYVTDKKFRRLVDRFRNGKSMGHFAVRWVCTGDEEAARRLVQKLLSEPLVLPSQSEHTGNGAELAVFYDLVASYPGWTPAQRSAVNERLRESVRNILVVLDGDSASLWHGRVPLAAAGMTAALALDDGKPENAELLARVQGHFASALAAMDLTEAWPEGYNYWVNSRGLPFIQGCLSHVNAVEGSSLNPVAKRVANRVGLWMIAGVEPIGRFHLFGDTGPRNDLREETQKIIDAISLLTGHPLFRLYSAYLNGLPGLRPYYWTYAWLRPLLRGLPELDYTSDEKVPDLGVLSGKLPRALVFGRESFGQVFMRSDWGPDGMFVSYRAGHTFTHHGHYQAGHFTITKKAPLAITSGTYGGWTTPHRLNYYIRTVAANSILVLRPGEKVQPNRFFKENVADGGQRVVMPTGSAVLSVEDWRKNIYKGRHFEAGRITAFDDSNPAFVYVGSDLTGAYNNTSYDDNGKGGKVSRITRQLVFLPKEERLVIHDRVVATDPTFTKKWLLHSWAKPETQTERVLVGRRENGIMESTDARAVIRYQGGQLYVDRLLPKRALLRKVGGPDYRYYVELDGDDSDLDGANMDEGAQERPWFDAGLWRIEIQPEDPRKEDRFLIVLKAGEKGDPTPLQPVLVEGGAVEGVETPRAVVLFGKDGMVRESFEYRARGEDRRLHVIVDLPPNRPVEVRVGGTSFRRKTSLEGTLSFEAIAGAEPVHVNM
ncbi:MAG: hypothetical protein GXP50_07525 [Deltaproteobacteria bacterium]|nr:hypothetical protein [Deltaproteobacteria bacterium]